MPHRFSGIVFLSLMLIPTALFGADLPISEATQECLDCHASIHPGIVSGWQPSISILRKKPVVFLREQTQE